MCGTAGYRFFAAVIFAAWPAGLAARAAETMPFQHKVEVYSNKETDLRAFTVRLEQPFLAEEFEKSNYLRLRSDDDRAYLIYPKEAKFEQKHAEFYGRLRGEGDVELTLTYETVTENLDGSRRVEVREGKIVVPVPQSETGPQSIFLEWARQQNLYFSQLLQYYPDESFFQYCLLQSAARYGVEPPPIPKAMPDRSELESELYEIFTGSLAIQESLQRQTLRSGSGAGNLDVHVSTLEPPALQSLPYQQLLKKRREEDHVEPQVHEVARLIPADQYLLHFQSMASLNDLLDLSERWGTSLLRMFTVRAQDHRLPEKLESQLGLERDGLVRLFADQVIRELAVTGSDTFMREGTDVTLIFRVSKPDVFRSAADAWLQRIRQQQPEVVDREFNYRGHQVIAHYTSDRVVSSFVVEHGDYIAYSNSHRAIRRLIDAATGAIDTLASQLDYQYITTLLPPSFEENSGYFYGGEAFIRQQIGPAAKISEKRRLQCFNSLVMLNNASLFYRLEYGRSPQTLSDLVEGRFVDLERVVCPHGGAYAFDAERDMCTCSLHNRLRYLTPNVELSVLNVSRDEAAQYQRYKQRYQQFWQQVFDPIAVRVTMAPRVRLETCVLPFANSSLYQDLRRYVDERPRPLGTADIARSAVVSLLAVPGRQNVANLLRSIPGMEEVLRSDPTLTDLSWIGDRASLHFCDGETILEIDPARFTPALPFLGNVSLAQQLSATSLFAAINLPVYATIEVENRNKASRLLEQLSQQLFLKKDQLFGLGTNLDAYRLPDYKEHAIYVFSGQVYAVKLRLHVALVGDKLVVATKPEILHQVIDATTAPSDQPGREAHLLLRFSRPALAQLYDEVRLYWAEKARLACHRNTISIYNLHRLYNTPIDQISQLSQIKYGVEYFCPDHGEYRFDPARNQVLCTVHGNRESSQQYPLAERPSSYVEFMESLNEVTTSLRFERDALIATVEIQRAGE